MRELYIEFSHWKCVSQNLSYRIRPECRKVSGLHLKQMQETKNILYNDKVHDHCLHFFIYRLTISGRWSGLNAWVLSKAQNTK